jgi:hypothetical protein
MDLTHREIFAPATIASASQTVRTITDIVTRTSKEGAFRENPWEDRQSCTMSKHIVY